MNLGSEVDKPSSDLYNFGLKACSEGMWFFNDVPEHLIFFIKDQGFQHNDLVCNKRSTIFLDFTKFS